MEKLPVIFVEAVTVAAVVLAEDGTNEEADFCSVELVVKFALLGTYWAPASTCAI